MTSAFRRKEMSGMSEEKKCYLQRNGRTHGPFSKANLKVSLKAGTLRATDLISVSHHGPWKAIADVPQLAKLLKPEPAVELFDHLYDDSAEKTYALYDEPTAPRKRSTAGEKKRSSRTSRITRSAVTAKSRASSSVPIQPEAEDKPRGIYKSVIIGMTLVIGVIAVGGWKLLDQRAKSINQMKIDCANSSLAEAVTHANDWFIDDNPIATAGDVEKRLVNALVNENLTETGNAASILSQVRQRRVELAERVRLEETQKAEQVRLEEVRKAEQIRLEKARLAKVRKQAAALLTNAKRQIQAGQFADAATLLRQYVADPATTIKAEARRLLSEVETATLDMLAFNDLVAMTEEQFNQTKVSGVINDGKVTHPLLLEVRTETIQRNLNKAEQRRHEMMVEEKKRPDGE